MHEKLEGARGVRLRAALAGELEAVRRLLDGASLPTDGLEDQFPGAYVVAERADGAAVGAAGLEIHGKSGLLRSLVVRDDARGAGIGASLVRDRLARARTLALEEVYLLTTTAAAFFARLGFEPSERTRAPEEVRASVEFARACPDTALAMRWCSGAGPANRGTPTREGTRSPRPGRSVRQVTCTGST